MAIAQPAKTVSHKTAGPASPATGRARAPGLPGATTLVSGSIIGTWVLTMPAVRTRAGTRSLLVPGVIAVGAVVLGQMFGQLTTRVPTTHGGLSAYGRHGSGHFAGHLTA